MYIMCIIIFRIFYYFYKFLFTKSTNSTPKTKHIKSRIRLFYSAYMHLFKKSRINSPRQKSPFHFLPFCNVFREFSQIFAYFYQILEKQPNQIITRFIAKIHKNHTKITLTRNHIEKKQALKA